MTDVPYTFTDVPYPTVTPPTYPYGQQSFGNMADFQAWKGTASFHMDSSGIWLGSEKFATAPFKVTMGGVATFTGMVTDWADLTGKPAFGTLALQNVVAWATDITGMPTFWALAYQSLVSDAMLDTTVIVGGYIKTTLINAGAIVIGTLSGAGTLAGLNSIDYTTGYLTNKPTLGSLASQSAVSAAMLDSTVIVGGYIKTSLLTANNITTGTLTGVTITSSSASDKIVLSNGNSIDFYYSSTMIGSFFSDLSGMWYDGQLIHFDGYSGTSSAFFDDLATGGTLTCNGKLVVPVGTNLY